MRHEYLQRLFKAFKIPAGRAKDIASGSVAWFGHDYPFDEDKGIIAHYADFDAGRHELVRPYAKFGINVLKNFLASALVESRFSTVTLVKSKYRMAISAKKIRGFLLGRDEPSYQEVTK
jgi:hypothetical protein